MFCQSPSFQVAALVACGLWFSGCGSANKEPEKSTVITPKAQEPQTPAKAADDGKAEVARGPWKLPPPSDAEPTPEPAAEPTVATTPEPAESGSTTASVAKPAKGGTTLKGRVVVNGTVPTPTPITPSGNDQYCIALKSIPNEEVVMGPDGGLANVFVWVRKVPSGAEVPAPPSEPAVLDQKNCHFIPRALIAQVGQELLVKNGDATSHNTRITGLSVSFNSIVGPNNREGIPVEFQRAEIVPVPVKCDIHGWMSCRILFTDNPWHTVTDERGNFEIAGLPAGELEFRLQHEKAGYVEKSLKLTFEDGQTIEKTFEVDAAKLVD